VLAFDFSHIIKCIAVFTILCVTEVCCLAANAQGSVHPISIPTGYPAENMHPGAGKEGFKGYPKRKNIRVVSSPGELIEADVEYRLEQDIEAVGTAFTIKASRVTLNLNGYTVTYLSDSTLKEAFGVHVPGYHKNDIAIVNGTIRQGDGECRGNVIGLGCNPVYASDVQNLLISGLEISYRAPDTSAVMLHWSSSAEVCFNSIHDMGSVVSNRHQGIAVIEAFRGGTETRHKIHHNLVSGARHIGIRAGTESLVFNNDIRGESKATNSFAISIASGQIYDNRIIGRGVHPIGIWPGNNTKIYRNYVEVQNTARGNEYGDTGASCLRMTWGNDNIEVMNNTFILKAEMNYLNSGVNSWGRAIWVGLAKPEQKAVFHNNYISARNADDKAKAAAVAVVCNNFSSGLVFKGNIISSNWANVLLADSYGHGDGYARFIDNVFEGVPESRSYRTVKSQYPQISSTGVFVGNTYVNGAARDSVDLEFDGVGLKEVMFGWHLNIEVIEKKNRSAISGVQISIADATGKTVFEGSSDKYGSVNVDLLEYTLSNKIPGKSGRQKVMLTPHVVSIETGSNKTSKTIVMDRNNQMIFEF
jgi:hypothetical protein